MLQKILVIFFAIFLFSCDPSNPSSSVADDCSECAPPRTFKINKDFPEFTVSTFGRKMGTPDATKIDDYLSDRIADGEINDLTVVAVGIEGGAQYCVVVLDPVVRARILDELQQISTDLEETAYKVESLENCSAD